MHVSMAAATAPPPLPPPAQLALAPLPCRQYEPDATFNPISIGQPKLDCSGAGLDAEQELWLLQLPLDVSAGRPTRPAACRFN